MRYLCVVRWEEFQHYRNRRAPWIKAYTAVLDPLEHPKFSDLSDAAKLTLHHIRLLAGVTGNQIPESWLTPGHLNMAKPRVTEVVDAGFVEWFEVANGQQLSLADSLARLDEIPTSGKVVDEGAARARGRARSQSSLGSLSSTKGSTKNGVRGSAREMVEAFVVTEKHRAWAAEKVSGVDVDEATEAWRDHLRSNGYRTRQGALNDVDGSWRNWMRNEVKFGRAKTTTQTLTTAEIQSLRAGTPSAVNERSRMDERLAIYVDDHGKRPLTGPEREAWNRDFISKFGFTPDHWNEADEDEKWRLAADAVRRGAA